MTRRAVTLLALVVALVASGACAGEGREHGDLLVTAARLFDGRSVLEPGAVLVREGMIVAVGESLDADATRRIDLGDATILPGFIDLHVHGAEGMLRGGVTTVRNVGSPFAYVRPVSRRRGLRVLTAGPLVSVPGGYPAAVWGPAIALEVRSVTEARAGVRRLVRRGAAVIKISLEPGFDRAWPMLSVAQIRAIVDEAHAHGVEVTAHATRSGVARALAGKVDELAHAPCGAADEELAQLVARDIEVVATLHVLRLSSGGCGYAARRIVALGGRLLYGSDLGVPGIPQGIDVEELRLLRDAGLTPEQVLASATSWAGEQIGLAPLGTLAEGAPADLIAVRADARDFRDDFAPPLLVVAGGRVVVARPR